MKRSYNFSAGPAHLPDEVLIQAQEELLNWQNLGASVMEISHRSKEFVENVAQESVRDLTELLGLPDDYQILFLQGGATGQFSMIPLNLLQQGESLDYVDTGIWSKRALDEAKKYAPVNTVASSAQCNYQNIPEFSTWQLNDKASYLHYCPNETIGGLEFDYVPDIGATPLVADMSSTLLSRPLDVSRFGLIYAGAQKNLGPAGLCLLIIRKDLLERSVSRFCPRIFNYKMVAENGSMLNTPPTFGWYLMGLVFKWIKRQGGLKSMGQKNKDKASLLYQSIDDSEFYSNNIQSRYRSWMNVPFSLANDQLNELFLKESTRAGLLYLKGHRSVGGMRASIYNATPIDAVKALIEFMQDFSRRYG